MQILHITHTQWIYRNASLHDITTGHLARKRRSELLQEIDQLSHMEPDEVPEGSRYLLEVDFTSLANSSLERQSYWVLAIEAAAKAGKQRGQLGRRGPAEGRLGMPSAAGYPEGSRGPSTFSLANWGARLLGRGRKDAACGKPSSVQ